MGVSHGGAGLVDERVSRPEDAPRPLLILAHRQVVSEREALEERARDRRVDVREERDLERELVAGVEALDTRLRPVEEVQEEPLRRAGVLVRDPRRGYLLGFLTKEFTLDQGDGPRRLAAVYVPTNHLYLGDVLIFPEDDVLFPNISVEHGIRVFLTGGMALPARMTAPAEERAIRAART